MEGDNDAEPPFEWVVSRICEEFHCLPTEAVNEMLDDPCNMALDILELRSYARMKDQIDRTKKETDMPTGPMAEWVWRVTAEISRRRKEARKNGDNE